MRPKSRTAERVLAEIAGRAWGAVTTAEMLGEGLTPDEIKQRVRNGALIREYRGVYRVGHRAPSVEARYMAAVKACGSGAKLSGRAAGNLLGLVKGTPPPPEVTAPTHREVDGIATHRSRGRIEATLWRGIPVTTAARTLVDLAGTLSFDDLAYACHQAQVLHRMRPEQVEAVLQRHTNAKGAATLRAIVSGDAPILLSRLEKRFLKLLKDHGLPLPLTNRPAGAHYVDCRWPQHRLTVELDSYTFHNSRYAFERDHRREREAYGRGDQFRRYTYGDVFERPETVLEELYPLLTREPGTMSSRPSGQRIQAL